MYAGLEPIAKRLRARLVRAMADADQTAFHHDQEGRKGMSLLNAGRSLAFEQVMSWIADIERDAKEAQALAATCQHDSVFQDLDAGAVCIKCSKDLGWYCNVSPKHYCEYTDDDECCIHCGAPEERQ